MKKITLMAIAIIGFAIASIAQNEKQEFQPNGKPLILVFSNFHTNFTDGESSSAFEVQRAYLGYEHSFSEEFSGKVVLDVADPGNGSKLEMTAYLKNALLQYKKGNFTALFGLISTTQFKTSEKVWGNRYIEKSFQDAHKFNSSADLGFSLEYKFTDFISADFSVVNGEGYKKLQSDDLFRTALGATVKPIDNVVARIYVDQIGDEVKQNSLATFVAYQTKTFTFGAEYNYQKNFGMVDSENLYGTSFYVNYVPGGNIKLIGRFDNLKSNTLSGDSNSWNINKDGQLILVGLELAPAKGVKVAPNFRGWNPADDNQKFTSSLFLNVQVKF